MAITLKDLTEMRQKISESRKKLEKQEEALRVLEGMISEDEIISDPQKPIDLDSLPVKAAPPKKSLPVLVREVIRRLGTQEFTVAQVESILGQQGNLPKTKTPRASIAMALTKLEGDKDVIRTHKGIGSDPHRFSNVLTAVSAGATVLTGAGVRNEG